MGQASLKIFFLVLCLFFARTDLKASRRFSEKLNELHQSMKNVEGNQFFSLYFKDFCCFVDFFCNLISMKVAQSLSNPKYAYLDKSQEAAATNSISDAGPIPDGSMAQLTPVSQGKEKASGMDWTFSVILAGGCVLFASLTTVACCCKLSPCRG